MEELGRAAEILDKALAEAEARRDEYEAARDATMAEGLALPADTRITELADIRARWERENAMYETAYQQARHLADARRSLAAVGV